MILETLAFILFANTSQPTTSPTTTPAIDYSLDLSTDRAIGLVGWPTSTPVAWSIDRGVHGRALINLDRKYALDHGVDSIKFGRDRRNLISGLIVEFPAGSSADARKQIEATAKEFNLVIVGLDDYLEGAKAGKLGRLQAVEQNPGVYEHGDRTFSVHAVVAPRDVKSATDFDYGVVVFVNWPESE